MPVSNLYDANGNALQSTGGALNVTFGALTNAQDIVAVGPNAVAGASTWGQHNLNGTVGTIKGAAGTVYGMSIINGAGAAAYVQFFDTASAPTLGTTAPLYQVQVPSGGSVFVPPGAMGAAHANAIKVASTTTDAGATGSANGVSAYVWYY